MTLQQVVDGILGQAGVIVLLLIILWSGWKGMWVFGRYYEDQRRRIDRLEDRLDRAGRVAESGTGLAQRAATLAEQRQAEDRHA